MVHIRRIDEADCSEYLQLNMLLDQETPFMLFEPGERKLTLEQQRAMILSLTQSNNSNLFVAEFNGQLVGHLMVVGGNINRIRHRAHLVIGILNEHIGRGIGQQLLNELEKWRQTTELKRLELTVMTHNERAISLYKKNGFIIEGVKKNSMKVNGEFVDEYIMGKTY